MKYRMAKLVLASMFLAILHAPALSAATNTIYIFNFNFGALPNTHIDPVINLGDTVTWVWTNGTHSTTAAPGQLESWDSGPQTNGFTFSHTFTNLGSFIYYCTVHSSSTGCRQAHPNFGNMTGTVTVVLGNLTTPYQIDSITQQGSDIVVDWITGGICMTNILQRSTGNPDGSFNTNFVDIFTVNGTTGNTTNFTDAGAVTNFPTSYYRVRVPQ